MREGWKFLNFDNCIEKVPSTTKIPKKYFKQQGKYPIISQEENFINGYWSNAKDVLKVNKPVVVFGDHTKIIKIIDFDFVRGADGVKVFLPKYFIDSKFFAYHLKNIKLDDLGYARHYRLLKKEIISVPPLSEQKQIVTILDKALAAIDQAKANIERNIENAEELFQSKLSEIFNQKGEGWEENKIGGICDILNGGTPKSKVKEYWNGPVAWITPANLGKLKNKYVNSTDRTISNLGLAKSSAKLFPANSVILSTRAPIGHLAINTIPMSTNQGCRGLVPSEKINTELLYYFLISKVKELNDLGTGATFKELSTRALSNVDISFPKKEEQNLIVDIINRLEINKNTLCKTYRNKLNYLDELKKSILQKAFTGELTSDISESLEKEMAL